MPSSSNAQSGLELVVQEPTLDEAWGTGQGGGSGIESRGEDEHGDA